MSVMTPIFEGLWDHYIMWSVLVGGFAFGWLYHHSFWFTSKDGDKLPNVDEIEIGVFPKHNDDMRLEVAWTILPFILIVWLTYYSWQPLDAMWNRLISGLSGLLPTYPLEGSRRNCACECTSVTAADSDADPCLLHFVLWRDCVSAVFCVMN